jgi:alkyl hydroperoxide reductase subunit AhpC
MELELKAVDETVSTRLRIFQQAITRKRDEIHRLSTKIEILDNELEAMKEAKWKPAEKMTAEKTTKTTKKRRFDDSKEELERRG